MESFLLGWKWLSGPNSYTQHDKLRTEKRIEKKNINYNKLAWIKIYKKKVWCDGKKKKNSVVKMLYKLLQPKRKWTIYDRQVWLITQQSVGK